MPQGRQVEIPLYSKAPFANYDIVVYLGGGLFSLLVAWRYIAEPFDIFDLSSLRVAADESWASQLILIVLLGVLSYVVGHLVSYLSSHFIEGFITRTIGSFSSVVQLATQNRDKFNADLVGQIDANRKKNFAWSRHLFNVPLTKISVKWKRGALVALFHVPMVPWYAAVRWLRLFNCLDTRLPARMFPALDKKLNKYFESVTTGGEKQWFRWVEYCTHFNTSVASAGMYNYLVISGLMRSLSFLLLAAIWAEIFHLLLWWWAGAPKLHVGKEWTDWFVYGGVLIIGYVCALTAYLKFYRRYVEEAVMGFLFEVQE